MADLYQDLLRQIVVDYGRSVCEEPHRVRGLLRDFLGGRPGNHEPLINVLVHTLEGRVVPDLLGASDLPTDILRQRVTGRVQADMALNESAAVWAVDTWGYALGLWPAGAAPLPNSRIATATMTAHPVAAAAETAKPLASAQSTQVVTAASRCFFCSTHQVVHPPAAGHPDRLWHGDPRRYLDGLAASGGEAIPPRPP